MSKVIWFLAVVLFASTGFVFAEEEAGEWVDGKVVVAKDKDGKVTAITVETVDFDADDKEVKVVYNVVLDENGNKLAELNGKNVNVLCKLENKGTKEKPNFVITVKKFEEVKAE
jgi:hypothetical protein